MGLLSRILMVFRTKANTAIDRAPHSWASPQLRKLVTFVFGEEVRGVDLTRAFAPRPVQGTSEEYVAASQILPDDGLSVLRCNYVEDGGFMFGHKANYRDVCVLGDCDDIVTKFCSLLGWEAELDRLMRSWRAPQADALYSP